MQNLQEKKKKYAELIIQFGLNLQQGQNLLIKAPIHAFAFVKLVAEEAYNAGVDQIFYQWRSDELDLLKYQKASVASFGKPLQRLEDGYATELKKNCAVLTLFSEDPFLFSQVQPELLNMELQARRAARKAQLELISSNATNRLITAVPNLWRAKSLYPDLSAEESIERLRSQIFALVRLDHEDPIEARKHHLQTLQSHAQKLNHYAFKKLHYHADKTELTVELPTGHLRLCAWEKTQSWISFCPNMPTEEVFTAPHKYGVNGTLGATLPLYYNGKLIEDFGFTFKDGAVVDFYAKKGYETLKSLLETDPWARRLWEVAIVPMSSPVCQSGLIFFNTLFDENASCHFALGNSYPTTIKDGITLDDAGKEKAGMNQSITHVDFMVGEKSLTITGETVSWEKIAFFVDGERKI